MFVHDDIYEEFLKSFIDYTKTIKVGDPARAISDLEQVLGIRLG